MSWQGEFLNAGIRKESGGGLRFGGPLFVDGGIIGGIGRGKVFYVDSVNGNSANIGTTPDTALATIDQAINKCVANRGDQIIVLPNHTESIAAASVATPPVPSLTCDIAGISIIGLGVGDARPKISFADATGGITVSAANVTFENIVFNANFADIPEVFTLSAKWLIVKDCDFVAAATNKNFLSVANTGTVNNQCDGLSFVGCSWIEPDTATLYFLNVGADIDRVSVLDCYFNLGVHVSDFPIIVNVASGKDITNIEIAYNKCIRLNDAKSLLVEVSTTVVNTGIVHHNFVRHLDVAAELLITAGTNIGLFENYASAVVDKSGYILPAVDA